MSMIPQDATSPVLDSAPLAAVALTDIEAVVRQALEQMAPAHLDDTRPGAGGPRVLPAFALWASVLVGVIRGLSSQTALWRVLAIQGLWDLPRFAITDEAFFKRLKQAEPMYLERIFYQVRDLLAARHLTPSTPPLAPFASGVYALDESTLDQVTRRLPTLRTIPAGARALLGGTIAGLFDIRHQQWVQVLLRTDTAQNEKVLARTLVALLPPGALILADLGYFGFQWFDDLTDQGHFWISRLRAKTSYVVLHTFYEDEHVWDGLVWLGAHRADRAKHAVRLVRYTVPAGTFAYLTNVRDPLLLPLAAIVQLYQRRWDIELAFKLLKQHLQLHLLWSSHSTVIQLQVWAALTVAQIVHALQVEIAARAGVEIFDVSLALLVQYFPTYALTGKPDPIAAYIEVGRQAGFIRPASRLRYVVPPVDESQLIPLPPDLVLTRTPRYAKRACGPRTSEPPPVTLHLPNKLE